MSAIFEGREEDDGALEYGTTVLHIKGLLPAGHGAQLASEGSEERPVGLGNLRNTCYLNSILQYFYTVNKVRDLVLGPPQGPILGPTEQIMRDFLAEKRWTLKDSSKTAGKAFVGSECASPPPKLRLVA